MKKFGLIGSGISDSGSPALFKAAYGGRYSYDLLDGNNFKSLFERFKKGYDAVNVTSPFKDDAFKAAHEASEAAELCGTANMLIKLPNGKILADNSDFEGVTLSIMSAYAVADVDVDDEDAFADFLADKTALVVGCSGAGKAAAAATVTLGYGRTILMNRTEEKAVALKQHLLSFYEDLSEEELQIRGISDFKEAFAEADAVIYAASAALDTDLSSIEANPEKLVLEANYKTPFLDKWKDKYTYIDGLNWLYNQAVVSYEAFTGEEPCENEMKQQLKY